MGAPFLYDYAAFIGLSPLTIMFGKPLMGLREIEAQHVEQRRKAQHVSKTQMTDEWLDRIPTEEDINQVREEILTIAKKSSKENPLVGRAERPRWMQHEVKPVRPQIKRLQCDPIPEKAMKSFVKKIKQWQEEGVII